MQDTFNKVVKKTSRAFLAVFRLSFFASSFFACVANGKSFDLAASGGVSIRLESKPDVIVPSDDLMLTFTIDSPSYYQVSIPDLRDRFTGFSVAEDFASEPIESEGRTRRVSRWRLTPRPAAELYRLAPFAVTVTDTRVSPATRFSFATRPAVFAGEAKRPTVTGDPEVSPNPIWIPPTPMTVALWIVFALVGIALLIAIGYGLKHLSRKVREFRMSPSERAMVELKRLLARNLPARGLYKDFYVELTLVVRRYIERSHSVRAPEQTTEEFLAAAAKSPAFTAETLASLRAFLQSADLVKFAGQEATPAMADGATSSARTYIENDSKTTGEKAL